MSSSVENIALKNDYFTRLEQDDEDGSEFTDRWNTGELLCLASAVQRSGDKNWVSVSRSIKPFGDPKRPADWYGPKNCALQYSKLLKGVEDFKKKSLPRTERETSEELLVKNLTDKRITELNWLNQQTKVLANSLRVHMEMIESGEYDDHLDELLKQIDEQERKEEEDFKEWIVRRESLTASKKLNKCRVPLSKGKAPARGLDSKRKNSPNPDQIEDALIHSILDATVKTEIESDHEFALNTKPIHIKQEVDIPSNINLLLEGSKASTIVPPSPLSSTPTSPLLTSLLRSVPSSNAGASVVSYVNSPLKEVKVESSSQSSNSSADNSRKTDVFLSPTKTVMTGISPLLTSLLKSPTSAVTSSTSMASHSKELDASGAIDNKSGEIDMAALIAKSQEASPRSSSSHSPRPTPASSPLLNSLLKSSPGSVSPLTSSQLAQAKDASSVKTVSSPQSFFNPTSALATAAAQQLAVATSTLPQSHVFFPQDTSESQKRSLQSSPATSACLSAPTLSKLLEMPPSTPGRLPPLPIVETVNNVSTVTVNVPEQTVSQSPKKSTAMLLNELELQISSVSPSKKSSESISSTEPLGVVDHFLQKKVPVPVSPNDKKSLVAPNNTPTKATFEPKVPFKRPAEIEDTSQENIDILEAVCESINQAFEKKEIKQEPIDPDDPHLQGKSQKESPEALKHNIKLEKIIPDDVINAAINIEKLISSDMGLDEKVFSSSDIADSTDLNLFEDEKQKSDIDIDSPSTTMQESEKLSDGLAEDKISGRKFYKSRTSKKRPSTEEDSEKSTDISPVKGTPKKFKSGKNETEVLPQIPVNEQLLLAAKEAEEATLCKTPEKSPAKTSEIRSPIAKKPRLFEKTPPKEKKELSEDETPVAKRPGRKAKKGRKISKSTPVKQEEPKDQYEFSESTEENSVGYQATNTLCYMPRLKEEESKMKQPQDTSGSTILQSSEESLVATSGAQSTEKKHGTPTTKNKPGKTSQSSARKGLFTSDEERMSDSVTSDDASNSHFEDDKLKTWKEYNEKKDIAKEDDGTKSTKRGTSVTDSPKKKLQQTKRNLFPSKTEVSKKVEKKTVSSDVEESSACSRDSEDAASTTTWQREDGEAIETKDTSPNVTGDVEVEANDSHLSSSVTVESDKPLDEMEGYESLQGSVTTDFSPLPQSDVKEEKDLIQFGKQDWYQGVSPKSSEPVSQSSEESEYESDNWDSQSVSTNKSATHSSGPSSKSKKKERESPQFKAWKKAISIVLREASCHKYANVFLQKVTNDVAPGYLSIVNRPMDLSLLKKNVDNGVVKTTIEVHRDMLLMFQNAVMYNSSDHDVHHMAIEMQNDVIQQMEAFLTTQFNDKDESSEPPSSLRGARSAKSLKVYGSTSKSKDEIHEKE